MTAPPIDGARLAESLAEMARIGATPKGGVRRLTLTEEDKRGRDRFASWAEAAGCTVAIDAIGNMFARRSGRDDSLAPVMVGSHLDSQPSGGKYDGVYGVLAGLEILRCLNDAGVETLRPIEAVSWTNEEGSRYAPAMMGSGVFIGAFALDDILARADADGRGLGDELRRIGYAGSRPCPGNPPHAYFEAHIEQGPVLEAEAKTIGVVQGIQGIRWLDCRLTGTDAHAGPTPMGARRDALLGAARLIGDINRIALDHAPDGRCTVGEVRVRPNSRNVVPGAVDVMVDMRHPDAVNLAQMAGELQKEVAALARDTGLEAEAEDIWYSPPTAFDPDCVAAVRRGAEALGAPHMDITSGAGHDAKYLADVCPTAMVFVPCRDGLSHNEEEHAEPADLAGGCQVLAHAVLEKANESD
ncbi:MAG: Zn-dependent hydrolase [Alphaproteobacteria bacterium]|jgi:N-carbamoyl-L-amino-acid hydrolase|nr:Zn-dependent hydrolase [Alphaproteobacteria bacterium]MDP6517030.1 Zn-dependent hydrolase [Alphaproteobacteria bacterium]